MAYTSVDFTATQSDADPSYITLAEVVVGSNPGLTARRILIALANGTYLTTSGVVTTPTYIDWPIANTSVTISVLPRSEAPLITVDWMTNAVATYTKSRNFCFDFADYIFGLGLTMDQVANNSITQDLSWYANKMQLIVNLSDAENAILYINDKTLSQNALDRNFWLISNSADYF